MGDAASRTPCRACRGVAGDAVTLGDEFVRYYDLARADAETPPGPVNLELFGGKGVARSAPVLPMAPLDRDAGLLVRLILEDVACGVFGSFPRNSA